ncbi:MAG: protein kinase, partial [Myxococcales bacterium]|nr:protein kinase [Myxococcales bacterium]
MSAGPEPARPRSPGAARLARVERLFDGALDQPEEERAAWLAAACDGDQGLLDEVIALLRLDARGTPPYLESPALRLLAAEDLPPGTLVGDGRYRVIERLGAGGLGVVHRAEQLEPVRREVALKVARPGLRADAALAAFEAESRALSKLSHPGIAQVYDVGRADNGRFFVAMELVDGEPLTTFCARHACGFRERLRLFLDVCRAVHHAHQRGIIHRDLKP